MEKKLFLRLVRTSDTTCYIEYSYHRIIPCWKRLNKWMYMLRTWGDVVLSYDEAKEFAKKFKDINDILAWNDEQLKLKEKYPDPIYSVPVIEYLKGE